MLLATLNGPVIELWHWLLFNGLVLTLLILDLAVFHRHARESTVREALGWTLFWSALALSFNAVVWAWLGSKAGLDFLKAYIIEWSLSMDNVFVFAVIFTFFRVPMKYQYRVLFWGILGAVVMRLTFILVGAALVQRFDWLIPIFGLFLLYTAYKLAFAGGEEVNPDDNLVLKLARRFLRVSPMYHTAAEEEGVPSRGDRFFVREQGKLHVTPLFLVLLVVESTDVLFAVDSVPVVLGVVSSTAHYFQFIAYTSNVFAILGLRALYFLLAGMMNMFRYLSLGLSAVLAFVGLKMIIRYLGHHKETREWVPEAALYVVENDVVQLSIIVALLGISIVASIIAQRRDGGAGRAGH